MKRFVIAAAILVGIVSGSAHAQIVAMPGVPMLPVGPQVSPNLIGIDNAQGSGWSGTIPTTSTGGGEGAGAGGSSPGFNSATNTIMFGYTTATAAYTYALSIALQNSGMSILGYNYSWDYMNQGATRGSLTASVDFAGMDGTSLHNRNWTLSPTAGTDWETVSGTETFAGSLLAANIANFSMSFRGKDDRGWAGYYGPQVRNPSLSLNFTFDQCSVDPLSSPTCPGFALAFERQQCTVNSLYSPSCPGYIVAYQTQQCNISPLYSPLCPGYTQAYYTQQCTINTLYDTSCPGYAAAYLDKQCAADPLYSTTCSGYTAAYAAKTLAIAPPAPAPPPPLAAAPDPVALAAPLTADPVVNSIITVKPAGAAEANPVAIVKLTAAPPPPPAAPAAADDKKSDSSNSVQTAKAEDKPADKPKTTREALAEQRREAAKKEAVARGKDLANEMGRAADMQTQMDVQNVLIQAMGFTPGFDVYNRARLPDAAIYAPYQAYPGQRNIDTPAGRRLFGGSDAAHQQMVDSQYNLGN